MTSRSLPVALLIPLLLPLGGCGRISQADKQAAIECVRANVAALQKGDLAAAAATLHPKSPAFLNTPDVLQRIMKTYKLSYELEQCEVERATGDGIHVRFVQVTRRVEGPDDFPDSRIEGMHLLKRDGSAWKIWFTQVRQSRTMDGQPLAVPSSSAEDGLSIAPAPPPLVKSTPVPVVAARAANGGSPAKPTPASAAKATPILVPFR